jgi:23S rRNA (uracil1939-C5)-methyltransferase
MNRFFFLYDDLRIDRMNKKTITIDSLAYQGSGVGRIEGKACFVPFSAPGDLLEVEIIIDRGSYLEARITTIIESSPSRTKPTCSLFRICGGCSWQHLTYDAQLEGKRQILEETLRRIGGIEIDTPEIIPSPKVYGYRNNARLRFNSKGEAGFYRFRSHDLVPVSACPILEPQLNDALHEIVDQITGTGPLPRETILQLDEEGKFHRFDLFSEKSPEPEFLQVNHQVNRILKKTVVEMVKGIAPLKVLDLYCGNGNLSLPLAECAELIEGWDISEPAIEDANRKARKLTEKKGAGDLFYRKSSIRKIALDLTKRAKDFSCLILDPPRGGLKGGGEYLAELEVPWILYVSCVPPVLARDLKLFYRNGYEVRSIKALDMFPQTWHLETVVLLSLKDPQLPLDVF